MDQQECPEGLNPATMTTASSGSVLRDSLYAEPVIIPVPAPFDHGLWPPPA